MDDTWLNDKSTEWDYSYRNDYENKYYAKKITEKRKLI